MKKMVKISTLATIISTFIAPPSFAADIVIGVPNWPSVRVTAHVLKVAMEENLGLEVELQNAANPVVFEAMDSGSMHVHPEVWLPNQNNLHKKFVKDKQTVSFNPNGVAGDQAMCVTEGTAKRTGISSLSDLTKPGMAKNFDTDGDGKGEIWIGASGWASTNVEKIRAKSYGYAETMNLKEMDESLALAEVDAAVAQNKNIVFFCYTPHHMFALHKLVILKEPAYDASKWNIKQPTEGADWLEVSEAPTAWDTAYLHIHFASAISKTHPAAAKMLSQAKLDTDIVSAMTYALVVEKQDPAEFASKWVAENSSLVDGWLK